MPQLVYVPALLKQANGGTFSAPLTWSEADNNPNLTNKYDK
jgi:hypothetical protein